MTFNIFKSTGSMPNKEGVTNVGGSCGVFAYFHSTCYQVCWTRKTRVVPLGINYNNTINPRQTTLVLSSREKKSFWHGESKNRHAEKNSMQQSMQGKINVKEHPTHPYHKCEESCIFKKKACL